MIQDLVDFLDWTSANKDVILLAVHQNAVEFARAALIDVLEELLYMLT